MMRGIVREATVQLEPRVVRLCEISSISTTRVANGPFEKEVEKIHIYCSRIVSYRDMELEILKPKQEHQENSEVR